VLVISGDASSPPDPFAATIITQVDFSSAGQIRDDDVFKTLIGPMPRGVTMTCIFDCCHSGTVLDLPYHFIADGTQEEMTIDQDFDFTPLINLFNSFMEQNGGKINAQQAAQAMKMVEQHCGPGCSIL